MSKMFSYCLFCATGAEMRLRDMINARFPKIRAHAAIKEIHKGKGKSYEIDRRVFLPGYLFLYAKEPIESKKLTTITDIYKMLGDEANAFELTGSDRAFAEWIYRNEGVIGISKIRNLGTHMSVDSGPMKHFGKQIVKWDKHTRSALIKMDFLGTIRDIWLAFEFMDEEINENTVAGGNEE